MERRIKVNINKGKYAPPLINPPSLTQMLGQLSAINVFSGNGRLFFFLSSFRILLFQRKRELGRGPSIRKEASYHMLSLVVPVA